jgi:hypothetical protein
MGQSGPRRGELIYSNTPSVERTLTACPPIRPGGPHRLAGSLLSTLVLALARPPLLRPRESPRTDVPRNVTRTNTLPRGLHDSHRLAHPKSF